MCVGVCVPLSGRSHTTTYPFPVNGIQATTIRSCSGLSQSLHALFFPSSLGQTRRGASNLSKSSILYNLLTFATPPLPPCPSLRKGSSTVREENAAESLHLDEQAGWGTCTGVCVSACLCLCLCLSTYVAIFLQKKEKKECKIALMSCWKSWFFSPHFFLLKKNIKYFQSQNCKSHFFLNIYI